MPMEYILATVSLAPTICPKPTNHQEIPDAVLGEEH